MRCGAAEGRGGVILVGLDRARTLRDQLGFSGLHVLLERLAEHIVQALGGAGQCIRFDWQSLLIIAPEMSASELGDSAEALYSSLADRSYEAGDDEVALTVSLAYARFDHRFTNADELLLPLVRRVECLAQEGGNALAEVRPGISAAKAISSSEHMLALLMDALRTDSIKVVFQPLLATSGRESVDSFQMLPRLAAGDGSLLAAAEFLPLAREAALLPVLDRWMTVHASRLLRGPLSGRSVRLFINQSEALLADAERRDWLCRQVESEGCLAGHLVLEIQLEDAMAHLRSAVHLIEMAHDVGVEICLTQIDEHCRWSLLSGELKVDYLRMSPGFVNRLATDPSLEKRFLQLSEAVRERGVRIIMPMIEDSQTAAIMWRSGADFMQGNMIQAPEDSIAIQETAS